MDRHNPDVVEVRQGETFGFRAAFQNDDHTPMDITGLEIKCQVRTLRKILVHDYQVEVIAADKGIVAFLPADTAAWPADNALILDFKLSLGAQVRYTEQCQLIVNETVTK